MNQPKPNEPTQLRPLTMRLARIAGARPEVLAHAPGGSGRQAAMGGVIVTTAALAAISGAFALHIALGIPVWLAAIFGIGWGVVILNLDRMLVLGMGHEQTWKKNLGLAVPRLVLACLLGFVISTPLTLQIFHKEIRLQMLVQQQDDKKSYDRQLQDLTDRIAAANARLARDQAIQAGGAVVDPAADPRARAASAEVASRQQTFDKANTEYIRLSALAQCEFDGTCGTKKAGDGEQYRSARARANSQKAIKDSAKQALDRAQTTLRSAESAARATAVESTARRKSDAAHDEGEAVVAVNQLKTEKKVLEAKFDVANTDNTGLLARLHALDTLGAKDPTMRWAQLLLAALFLCVEVLPVLMKFLMTMGSKTAYEQVASDLDGSEYKNYQHEELLRDDERKHRRQLELHKLTAQADAASKVDSLIVTNEQQRVEGQRRVLTEINDRVAEEQKKVVLRALEIWSAHAERESERVLRQYEEQVNRAHEQADPTVGPFAVPDPTVDMQKFSPTRLVDNSDGSVRGVAPDDVVGTHQPDSEYMKQTGLPSKNEV